MRIFLIVGFTILLINCTNSKKTDSFIKENNDRLSGDLIVFHAGSLTVPMKEISTAFKSKYPDVNILIEVAGSVECARKITELKKPCDIMASADYTVIDKLLIPDYAEWGIKFVTNEMAIVFSNSSKRSKEINQTNWYSILLDKNVQLGRADPNSDPCGYRTILVTKLAEKYYLKNNLSEDLLSKSKMNIRPKEVDLLALLETGNVDYIFLYRSVAEQHKLNYIILPDEVNLKNPNLDELYKTVSVEINGKKPGETIHQIGEPMVYGITIPIEAPNKVVAVEFIKFLLSKEYGMMILNKYGQPSVIPALATNYDKIPAELKEFAINTNSN